MRWSGLSRRDRRALVLGGAILTGSVIGLRGAPAWLAWHVASRESAVELELELARSHAALAAFPASIDTLEARLARLGELNVGLVIGGSETELEASVARVVEDAARRSSVRIEGIDLQVPPGGAEPFRRVRAHVRASGDVTGLSVLLAELEGSTRLLAIRELAVSANDVHAPPDQPEHLAFRFMVETLAMLRTEREAAGESGGEG